MFILGAPHIHSLLWLADDEGNMAPNFKRGDEDTKEKCVVFDDSVICGKRESSAKKEDVEFFQSHSHTFTCRYSIY